MQRIQSRTIGRAVVNFVVKDEVYIVSMSPHVLVRVDVHSESKMALFDSDAVPNVMLNMMVKKLHFRM